MKKLTIALLCLLLALPIVAADKKIVTPPGFNPNSPFSAGVIVGGTLYVAGQTGPDPKTNKPPENFQDEVKNSLERIGGILKAGGYDFPDVVNVTVYLTDISLFPQMNQVYTTYFKTERPARATVQVAGLVGGARIEISAIAAK